MIYKGYSAKVEYDDSVKVFHGHVIGLKDVVTFEGSTVKELEKEFRTSVDTYLDFCAAQGRRPEKPYSGEFRLRLDPALHRQLALAAETTGESLNGYVVRQLQEAVRNSL